MNWLSFVSSLLWPGVALTALVMFRKNLNRWIEERPQKVKVAGVLEAEWREQVDRVVEQAATARQDSLTQQVGENWPGGWTPLSIRLLDKVRDVPVLAVLEGWEEVQSELVKALSPWDTRTVVDRPNLARMLRGATAADRLPAWVEPAYHSMRNLRNLAVHSNALEPSQAFQFLGLADLVLGELRREQQNPSDVAPSKSELHE